MAAAKARMRVVADSVKTLAGKHGFALGDENHGSIADAPDGTADLVGT